MEAILLIGAQASGKSTFFAQRFADTHVRINLDMLKTRHRERELLSTCLEIQQPFVVDNTHPTPEDRARVIEPVLDAGFRVRGFYFESKIADLLQRNAQRPAEQRVPDTGVLGTHARLVIPTLDEGFDELHYVRIDRAGSFTIQEWLDEVR